MAFAVFEIAKSDRAKFDQATAVNVKGADGSPTIDRVADLIQRQTITIKEGQSLGLDDGKLYILIEGADEAVKQLEARLKDFGKRAPGEAEVRQKIQDEEESAAAGVGSIFG